MTKTELPMTREPDRDRLFRCSQNGRADALIRVRSLEVPGQASDVLVLQLQSALAKDETGDVAIDAGGAHLIFSPSRHTFYLTNIVAQGDDAAAMVEERVLAEAESAALRAWAREAVVPKLAKWTGV